MLDIPELFLVIEEWDREVRKNLPDHGYWFAPLSPETGTFDPNYTETGKHRSQRAGKDLREWHNKVNLPYHSPNKFRHGFAVHTIMQAKDMKQIKSISQNMMHSNVSITDGVYGSFSNQDVGETIKNLGAEIDRGNVSQMELIKQIELVLMKYKKDRIT